MNLIFYGDKLVPVSHVTLGRVVKKQKINMEVEYGHIVGFFRNSTKELILKVLWDNGKEFPIHPSNIELL